VPINTKTKINKTTTGAIIAEIQSQKEQTSGNAITKTTITC